jgi:hypothetical protein
LGAQLRLGLWNLVPSINVIVYIFNGCKPVNASANLSGAEYFGSAFLVPVAFAAELFLITPFELGQC